MASTTTNRIIDLIPNSILRVSRELNAIWQVFLLQVNAGNSIWKVNSIQSGGVSARIKSSDTLNHHILFCADLLKWNLRHSVLLTNASGFSWRPSTEHFFKIIFNCMTDFKIFIPFRSQLIILETNRFKWSLWVNMKLLDGNPDIARSGYYFWSVVVWF